MVMSTSQETIDGARLATDRPALAEFEAEAFVARRGTRGRRGWVMRRLLLAADLIGLVTAFALAELIFWDYDVDSGKPGISIESLIFLATLPLWVVGLKLYGLYDRDEEEADHSTSDELPRIFHLITVAVWMFFATSWIFGLAAPDPVKLASFWLLAIVFVPGGRIAARTLGRRLASFTQNAVVLGAGEVGQLIGRKLLKHPEYGVRLVGFVDAAPRERRADLDNLTLLGRPDELPDIIDRYGVERVIVAFSNESHEEILDLLRSLKNRDVQVDIVPRLFEIIGPAMGIHSIEGVPIVSLPPLRLSRSSRLMKRTIDLVLAAASLVLLAPLIGAIAAVIKLDSRGPVFFRQVRVGSRSKPFRIFKFRTMYTNAEERKAELASLNKHAHAGDPRMFKIPDDPRITRVGRILRRYSLDELPQLFNVLKGEMSIVGPRPLILDEDEHVGRWARRRLDLKPGITGLWQVTGRSEMLFDEMVKLDYLYVTGWSLGGDLRLIARTLPSIWRVRSVY
jgi:exopolysaccharide biosynthesis polyprenyl glycosylphosphotransferase